MKPIYRKELSYSIINSKIKIFYKKKSIGLFDKTFLSNINQEMEEIFDSLIKGDGYSYFTRNIREIQENYVFPIFYDSFDTYILDWPEAERFQAWITNNGKRECLLFQCNSFHDAVLPGNYLWANIIEFLTVNEDNLKWGVRIHDNDDGNLIKYCKNEKECQNSIVKLKSLAPIDFTELVSKYNYSYD